MLLNLRKQLSLIIGAMLLAGVMLVAATPVQPAAARSGRQVWAYYMGSADQRPDRLPVHR